MVFICSSNIVLSEIDPHQVQALHHCLPRFSQLCLSRTARNVQRGNPTLSENRVAPVIAGLRRMHPRTADAEQKIAKLNGYLENQRERLDYDACKRQGMPIGSGGIESANKFVSHVRLKRSGTWWVVDNGNAMLRLRCALYNGTFDKVFEKYRKIMGKAMRTNA